MPVVDTATVPVTPCPPDPLLAAVGRPPAPPSYPISIRVSKEQNDAYKAAGGAKWLKALLDKQIKKQK